MRASALVCTARTSGLSRRGGKRRHAASPWGRGTCRVAMAQPGCAAAHGLTRARLLWV